MAPYLYLFVQDALGYMLNGPFHGIEGLLLPDNSTLRESFFADDSTIFLKGTQSNMEKLYKFWTSFVPVAEQSLISVN